MFSMSVKVTGKKLSGINLVRALTTWENEVAPAILAEIKRRAPVSPTENGGRLRDSFSFTRRTTAGGIEARFVSSAPYARFVEDGTGPHRIEARQALALHWTSRGQSHFAQLVNHPGSRANPFVRRAIEAMRPLMAQKLREHTEEELRR